LKSPPAAISLVPMSFNELPDVLIRKIITGALSEGAPHVTRVCKIWESYSPGRELTYRPAVVVSTPSTALWYSSFCSGVYDEICPYAANCGRLSVIKYFHKKGYRTDIRVCASAAAAGRVNILKYGRENGFTWWPVFLAKLAVNNGRLAALKYIYEQGGVEWSDEQDGASICSAAAERGYLSVIKYAQKRGCYLGEQDCAKAAAGGQLEVLRFLREKGCPWSDSTCANAAAGGHLVLLKWARKNGCPWDESACWRAASGGHMDVLRYLRKKGNLQNRMASARAAAAGHLEVVKYLHENGCYWDSITTSSAAEAGHIDILRYAHQHGCPIDMDDFDESGDDEGYAVVMDYLASI